MGWGRTSKTKYRTLKSQRPDSTAARSTKRLASRFYQVKTGTAFPGSTSTRRRANPPRSVGGAGTRCRLGSISSRCARSGRHSRKSCGRRC